MTKSGGALVAIADIAKEEIAEASLLRFVGLCPSCSLGRNGLIVVPARLLDMIHAQARA